MKTKTDCNVSYALSLSVAVNDSTGRTFLPQNPLGVFIRFSRVNYYRKIEFFRNANLRAKDFTLNIPRRIVVVVIESGLTDRDNARIRSQLLHLIKMPRFSFCGIVRMDANARPNPVMSFGEGDSTTHVIRPASVADRQNSPNAGIPRSLEDRVAIRVEARVIQVCMRVNQHSLQSRAVGDIFVETHQHGGILRSNRSSDDHAIGL